LTGYRAAAACERSIPSSFTRIIQAPDCGFLKRLLLRSGIREISQFCGAMAIVCTTQQHPNLLRTAVWLTWSALTYPLAGVGKTQITYVKKETKFPGLFSFFIIIIVIVIIPFKLKVPPL
jgi:hypothetical protein